MCSEEATILIIQKDIGLIINYKLAPTLNKERSTIEFITTIKLNVIIYLHDDLVNVLSNQRSFQSRSIIEMVIHVFDPKTTQSIKQKSIINSPKRQYLKTKTHKNQSLTFPKTISWCSYADSKQRFWQPTASQTNKFTKRTKEKKYPDHKNPTPIKRNTHRSIIWVVSGHGSGGFGGQFIELASGDTLVDASTDLLRHKHGVTVIDTQTITQLLQPRCYLIEMHSLLLPVSLHHIHL